MVVDMPASGGLSIYGKSVETLKHEIIEFEKALSLINGSDERSTALRDFYSQLIELRRQAIITTENSE